MISSLLPHVLTINGGSSRIRFAIFETRASLPSYSRRIERIGQRGTNLVHVDAAGVPSPPFIVTAPDHRTAADFSLGWFERQSFPPSIQSVGHRVVRGMRHSAPERITPALLAELHRITPYAPDHRPREFELISTDAGQVIVRVIRNNEEPMIARSVTRVFQIKPTLGK